MDTLTSRERSYRMSLVKSKNTKPELVVRRAVSSLGRRYRLHDRKLPGCPDLAFASQKKAIFVHGCFWHRHSACGGDRVPKSRLDFWKKKLDENKKRDQKNLRKLNRMGWKYIVVWECQIKSSAKLIKRLEKFLGRSR